MLKGTINALDKQFLGEIVNGLFPRGAHIVSDPEDVPPNERFWLVFGGSGLRWIIPQDSSMAIKVLRQWQPYSVLSFLSWKALLASYCHGYIRYFPRVVGVGVSEITKENWGHAGWSGGTVTHATYIGTDGPARKAVTTLVDAKTGVPCSVVKTPLTNLASEKIIYEYDVLSHISANKKQIAPKPIFINREMGVSRQDYVEGFPTGRSFSKLHVRYLQKLKESGGATSVREQAERLTYDLLQANTVVDPLRNILIYRLSKLKSTTLLPSTINHGDFVPWNIKKIDSDNLIAVDWEDAILEGLPFFDFFYFQHFQNYLFGRNVKKVSYPQYGDTQFNDSIMKEIELFSLLAMVARISEHGRSMVYFEEKLRSL